MSFDDCVTPRAAGNNATLSSRPVIPAKAGIHAYATQYPAMSGHRLRTPGRRSGFG